MYDNLVYTITNALEEKEREEFTRLKVIKRMKTNNISEKIIKYRKYIDNIPVLLYNL